MLEDVNVWVDSMNDGMRNIIHHGSPFLGSLIYIWSRFSSLRWKCIERLEDNEKREPDERLLRVRANIVEKYEIASPYATADKWYD